jgi:predicted dehydrogenase
MRIGVVGLGYWGPNLVRNFAALDAVESVLCFDTDPARLELVARQFPKTRPAASLDEILRSDCAGVAVATPISSHHGIGIEALRHGKHLLMEKPLAAGVREGEELVREAERRSLTLMVDHTFIYTGAVRHMRELLQGGGIGEVYYVDSVRVNLGLFQHDVNVLWDLAPHDIAIMTHLLGHEPESVSAIGVGHLGAMEDVAYLTMRFEGNVVAHLHVNWLAPVKVRRMLIGGSQKMIVYDDMEPSEKVKVYDRGVSIVSREGIYKTLVEYRTGDMSAPKLDTTEALALVAGEFVRALDGGPPPAADGRAGLSVLRVLEAAQRSMTSGGAPVRLR